VEYSILFLQRTKPKELLEDDVYDDDLIVTVIMGEEATQKNFLKFQFVAQFCFL
jgi:hypothetical protein